ncbi:ABC transporter permease [Salicibibacter cibarius]|uniref:Transport permease protein n=1 Tax=Salicibibacter cibarius TaxID=2743000 RepID=A0A7T6Z587_9BACI|nr:ABC transporter permease [Salicibibacter cibarius]QQK76947.1 ABC transporter permease [Salicibibacter cibarius]
MWAVANIETRKQLQDKSLLFWSLVLPIVFIMGFMAIFAADAPDETAIANQIITGFSVFFAVFIIISMVISFVKDRENGFVARMASTPLTPGGYFIGKWLPFGAIVVGQIMALAILGIVVYGMSIDQPFFYLLIACFVAMMVTSWGVAIAMFSKTENTGLALTQVIAFAGAILGGLWMPFETLPDTIQTIGSFSPQYWAHQAFLSTLPGQPAGENVGIALLILLAYTGVGFALAFVGYREFLRESRN